MSSIEEHDDIGENTLFSSQHGWIEPNRIQRVVSTFDDPGLIYLPSGTWSESLIISQHNLTIIGEGTDTILKNDDPQSPITILAPNVRIINMTVQSSHDVPAISLNHGDAPQTVLQNVHVSESESHGVYRNENYGFAVGAILNCTFQNISEHAIYAPTGTGPYNLIFGNTAENVGGDFIQWGVNNSILAHNMCEDSPITLTENARRNLVLTEEDTEVNSGWPEENVVI